MVVLLLAQVILFSIFPLYFSFLSGSLRRTSFYTYIALVLLIGGFFGNVYSLPITEKINISGGNLCYGAFMMASVLFVFVERDIFILRHLVRLVVLVNVFNVSLSLLVGKILTTPGIINPHSISAALFDVSIAFIILGGSLIIAELLFLFYCFDAVKKRQWSYPVTTAVYILLFIFTLCLDGVLFPFIAFGINPVVLDIVIGGLSGKIVMTCSFSIPLIFFAIIGHRSLSAYLANDTVKWSSLFTINRQLKRELSEKNYGLKQAATVFNNVKEGLAVVDTSGLIIKANPAFCSMVGLSKGLIPGVTPIHTLFSSADSDMLPIDKSGHWRGEVKFGKASQGLLTITPVGAESSQAETYVYSLVNIDELKETQNELFYLARHDPLTGLENRRVLDEIITDLSAESICLIVVDLDHFKDVNDSYGHGAGDMVLSVVGQRLLGTLSSIPTFTAHVCRTGGDEFAVLIVTSDKEVIDQLSQTIQGACKSVITLPQGSEIYVSATLGVSFQGPSDKGDILQKADSALYAAKSEGRGSIGYYEEKLTSVSQRKIQLSVKLKQALEAEQLQVFYQPQYASATKKIVGVEALVRWYDAELGWIGPDEFIPVAEEMGLIEKLGEWVLLTACKQGKAWLDSGIKDIKMSVNVSAHQLRFGQFMNTVKHTLLKSRLPASMLQLELTESSFIEREQDVIPQLVALKALGIQLAIDDFGTGYSSLSYVAILPWDTLKIDRSFINRLPEDKAQRQMTDTILQLASNMDLVIVVEGVETQAQFDYLQSKGCEIIQGYYFSPAVPADKIIFPTNRSTFVRDEEL